MPRTALFVRTLLIVLWGIAAIPALAGAQGARLADGGMDLRLFRPAVDSKGHFSVNGTDVIGRNDFSFGLILDVGVGLLPFRGYANNSEIRPDEATRTNHIVDQLYTGTLHFNYGIANLLVVGIQVPVHVVTGARVHVPGYYNESVSTLDFQNFGDITLHTKFRLLRAERNPIGLAAIVHLQLPTGSTRQFAGEPGVALWPVGVLDWRPHRRFRASLNVGYRHSFGDASAFPVGGRTEPGSPSSATMAQLVSPTTVDFSYGGLLTFGAGMSFRAADSLDIVLETYGTQVASKFGTTGAFSMEALAGLKIFVQQNSYLMVGAGPGLFPTDGFQRADFRGVLGFIFEPSIGDRDGDGLKDDIDQCPDEPEDFDGFQDEDGCPDPDNDRDGIPDELDKCPLVPEDFDGEEDDDGCPEGNLGDRDGDGIPDHLDQCPDDPEDFDGFQDADGCPDPDNDGDGIPDVNDLCPNDPEDFDGFQDADGCPDPDNDKDGIPDVSDACPNDPETYNGYQDQDGCPDRGKVIIEDNQIVILEKIYFETDSAVIQKRSYPIIDAVAATLNGNPQITMVEVQGHADERGSDAYNIRLTRDRAASVVDALVQRGVHRNRLRSGGYGFRCPVDPRSNAEAWEKNRRVEFKIIQTEDGPTGVEVACPAGRALMPK